MMRIVVLAILLAAWLFPASGACEGWQAPLTDSDKGPQRFVAIDKNSQTFFLFERKSPLRVVEKLPCTTGSLLGDKLKEGDLRTPEGVYFITSRLDGGLDWEQYGDLAFPLNFPNPVDIIKGKTGHGIWIHGRGNTITPYETKGCVALNTPDIRGLDNRLELRMPVVIGNRIELEKSPETLAREADEVVAATHAWAKAWEARSEAFFEFHDAQKFAVSQGQPFSAFRNQKEGLFRKLPWILVAVEDVRAVAGPDYWVTYFIQFYRSPSLISQGVKRLYWQKNDKNKWAIVGMEFEQMEPTLAGKYVKPGQVVLAAADLGERERETPVLDKTSEEDLKTATDAPKAAYPQAAAPVTAPAIPPAPAIPASPSLAGRQVAAADQAAQPAVTPQAAQATPLVTDHPLLAEAAAPRPGSLFAAPAAKAAVSVQAKAQPESRAEVQAEAAAPAPARSPEQTPAPVAAKAPAALPTSIPTVEPPVQEIVVAMVPDTTQDKLAAKPQEKIVTDAAVPAGKSEVETFLENWRAAWERGDLDAYMGFYGDRAAQGDRRGLDAIREHKVGLWAERPPRSVRMEDVRVTERKNGWRVEFVQRYAGKDGFEDKGVKRMVLVKAGPRIIIVDEQWSAM